MSTEKGSTTTLNFEYRRRTLIEYMRVKMEEADWHGVSDAANDLREIEAEEKGRSQRPEYTCNICLERHSNCQQGNRDEPVFST